MNKHTNKLTGIMRKAFFIIGTFSLIFSTICPAIAQSFSGDSGVTASASIGKDIIGHPQVTIKIKNNTEKEIAALLFYAIPYNVYGEEVKSFLVTKRLFSDDPLASGKSDTRFWQLLDTKVKTVKLYLFSVYFEDGTQWGDKEADREDIITKGQPITVTKE